MEEVIFCGLKLLPVCAAVLMFLVIRLFCEEAHPQQKLLAAYQEFAGMLRDRRNNSSWYQKKDKWLLQNGVTFHYGKWMSAEKYLAMQFVLAASGMAALSSVSWEYGLIAGGVLFHLPSCLLMYLNNKDNEKLLPELKLVYHALEIQIRAGVYVMDALSECYGSVRERRLRSALLELAGDIVMKADIYEALDKFQCKFDNRYVDSLCITMLQTLESGQAVELLGDIGEQIKDMEETVLERKKGKLERSLTFYQLGILVVVLGIALYACVTYMFGTAAGL